MERRFEKNTPICTRGRIATSGGKLPKNDPRIVYQYVPSGANRCDNCTMFVPSAGCTAVDGVIAASGWCKIHFKKLGTERYAQT